MSRVLAKFISGSLFGATCAATTVLSSAGNENQTTATTTTTTSAEPSHSLPIQTGGVASSPATPAEGGDSKKSALPDISAPVTDMDSLGALAWRKTWGVDWVSDWDLPKEQGIRKVSSNYKRQIVMIRHGQYENEKSSDDSIRKLTPLGRQQAAATGEYLKKAMLESPLFAAERPTFVYVSDMTRARETAELIKDGMQGKWSLTMDSLLREKFPCDPQPVYKRKKAKLDSMVDAEKAYMRYFHRPKRDGDSVEVIVGHANMIRYFLCRSLQLPPEAWLRFSLPHCSITTVTIRGNGHVSVNAVGSVGHLPPDQQTVHNLP